MFPGKNIDTNDMKKVSGGAAENGIIGMETYAVKHTSCPKCQSKDLKDKDFMTDDKTATKPGQLCSACGYSWLIGK